MTGRVRLDGGEIRLFDRVLAGGRTPPELGVVPQDVAIYELLTARENLSLFGRLQGLSGADLDRQITWALDRTGLSDRAGEVVKKYSGGMRRRLNIACGLLHRPRVLLLDEPTVGVDPQSRDRIYDVLDELAADGVSMLLTTHHLEEAEARCSRTVIIDHGRVIASGTLSELVDRTVGRHRHVTLFLDNGAERSARLDNVAIELPPLLASVAAEGRVVQDLEVRCPSLQAVFIHLTGRELRE
jgi:ABC-2 type transport system ATP-binding protein